MDTSERQRERERERERERARRGRATPGNGRTPPYELSGVVVRAMKCGETPRLRRAAAATPSALFVAAPLAVIRLQPSRLVSGGPGRPPGCRWNAAPVPPTPRRLAG